jgi:tetratricopeptide (TPR) repeat protein
LDGAFAAYRDAIRINPELALAHYNLGLALMDNGDNAGAKASFETYLCLDPDNAQAAAIRTVIAQLS